MAFLRLFARACAYLSGNIILHAADTLGKTEGLNQMKAKIPTVAQIAAAEGVLGAAIDHLVFHLGREEALDALVARQIQLRAKEPKGGDALTPVVWKLCTIMYGERRWPTPNPIMAELKNIARTHSNPLPLLGDVIGGVKYETGEGEERELTRNQLASRINEWARANNLKKPKKQHKKS